MPILTDFHTHSSFSEDSHASMQSMIDMSIKMGFTHLCFTEHMDMDFPVSADFPEGSFLVDTPSYQDALFKYREQYNKKINLLFGIELGLQPHLADRHEKYISSYPFDFVIASSHICHKKDPYEASFFENRTEKEAYEEYFQSILENIQSFGDFDVYGHLDYVIRYGPNMDKNYTYPQYQDILDEILTLLIEKGKGIELNTAGLKYGLKDLHPCRDILKRYKQLGGEIITIGSDAHAPSRIGEHFAFADDTLKECGFRYYTIFSQRKPEFIKL